MVRGNFSLKRGFTLVELSIVIAIIGLLIAGITVGASLMKQAEIRAVVSELQTYQTAYNNFRGTYSKIPGDMNTASAFWTVAACAESAALCDGDGNRLINEASDNSNSLFDDETRPAWKHLALAGMISAGIPIVPTTFVPMKPGSNVPASKLSGAGYDLTFFPFPPSGANVNVLILGKPSNDITINNGALLFSALTPQDAFTIDQKLDDGVVVTTMLSPIDRLITSAFAIACDICVDVTCGCDPSDPDIYNACVAQNESEAATSCGGSGGGGSSGGGSTSDGAFTGAVTGNIVVGSGADAPAQCTNGSTYDFTNTEVSCVIAMRVQ